MIKKIFFFIVFLCCFFSTYSQIVINEIDADNPGSDNKEFVELKSSSPTFSLDGYVMVFFNGQTGAGTLSYFSLDLDGYTTDVNGIIHFGNAQVSPSPTTPYFPLNTIQNGPDVIAIFIGNATDYPLNTPASNINLINAVAYSTSTSFPTTLMNLFGVTICSIDNQPLGSTSNSIQRKNDGTYEVKPPTPGVNNDGSGIVFNYVTTTTTTTVLSEGQTLIINFNTSEPVVSQPLVISFSLNNDSFNSNDFFGLTSVTIPVGSSTASASIQLLDDSLNEGDEELKIVLNALPVNYYLNNNDLIVRVNDVNYVVLPFGTPLNPTFNNVTSTAPNGYYSSLEGLSGTALKQTLQDIIANPSVVRAHNYGDVETILKVADQNPANSNQVWLMYVEEPRSKLDFQDSNSNVGKWNREHIFPQSRGGFQDGTLSLADGINLWLPTNANDILAGHADAHHLRAEDGPENSLRSNRDYGSDYNGPTGNLGSWKGDVARSLFYMAVRYNALSLVNGNPADSTVGQIGDLASLLQWNNLDPRDDFEMNRNNYIYTWQMNRNPFIDYPNLADYIWGANFGQTWFSSLSNANFEESKVAIYPNPSNGEITISGLDSEYSVEVYNSLGSKIYISKFVGNNQIQTSWSSGIYFAKITSDSKSVVKKIVVR
jgi:Endonuclease I/Secretion system C-terminal sorting domain